MCYRTCNCSTCYSGSKGTITAFPKCMNWASEKGIWGKSLLWFYFVVSATEKTHTLFLVPEVTIPTSSVTSFLDTPELCTLWLKPRASSTLLRIYFLGGFSWETIQAFKCLLYLENNSTPLASGHLFGNTGSEHLVIDVHTTFSLMYNKELFQVCVSEVVASLWIEKRRIFVLLNI